MQHLFVYGSLLFPELVKAFTGKNLHYIPVTLAGYKRCRIESCDYPAIFENSGSIVEGALIKNVDERSLEILSFFEGDEYEKKYVTVFDSEVKYKAIAYVWIGQKPLLKEQVWDATDFQQSSLHFYIDEIVPQTLQGFYSKSL